MFCLFLTSQLVCAQLNDFNFSVSTSAASCASNGSIAMTVSGITTGAEVTYILYLSPDLDTPIAQTSESTFSNLASGQYVVEARQTLNADENTQSADAHIEDVFSVLDFEISQGFTGSCNNTTVMVTTLSGSAELFEVISGPVTVPPQLDNTFNNLPEGTYIIRVFDTCGNAITKTYTLILSDFSYSISTAAQPNILNNCDETTIIQVITASNGSQLFYPITVDYSISYSDGNETTNFSQTHEDGPETELEISVTVTDYDDQSFTVETEVQDSCGDSVSHTENIDPTPEVNMSAVTNVCGNDLIIDVSNIVLPYTLEFIEAPAAFNFSDYYDNGGVFTETVVSFEDEDLGVPYGYYEVNIVDACERTGTAALALIEEPILPNISATNGGCDPLTGALSINIPNREIVSAVFTEAPDAYENGLPDDMSNFITDNGYLVVDVLPKGTYVVELVDSCGDAYVEVVEIPELEEINLNVSTFVGCSSDVGSLRINGAYGAVASVLFIEAPSAFSQTLPFDYSAAILPEGFFYVDDLPVGDYTIEFTDSCGNEFMFNQVIESYNYSNNEAIFNLQKNCGSFDLSIMDTDVSVENQSYWFQKYYPENEGWGHPSTGVLYDEDQLPNTTNAISLQNGESLLNNFVVGSFRLIKVFQSAINPDSDAFCFDVFGTFEITSDLVINDVFNLNCEGGSGPSDIIVDVAGVPPYNFSIVSPIFIDNGENNVFSGLSAGIYDIRVEDVCGQIEAITVNTNNLVPVVNLNEASDLVSCQPSSTNQVQFDLSQQNAQLLGNQNPDDFTITYHVSQNDADNGVHAISENYENISNPQTIYVRMVHNTLDICYETGTFQLIVGSIPQLEPDEFITLCEGNTVLLSAASGYTSYLWSTGETTRSIVADTVGDYTVTVSNDYSDFSCDATKTYTITVSSMASIEAIITEDFTSHSNFIDIEVSGLGNYEYSLDGINYQLDSYFDYLDSGIYTVYVKDSNGCGITTEDISLINYKKFFTPNGDGENEYWHITGAQLEPDLQVYIYDRYGKLLVSFSGNDSGWDGRYNGNLMPTSDYWFVVKRSNGLTHRGHFTLKR
ncbi:T9SS type B sorting domain-containing protein [Winogradskyella eckloniae]|uniref:T9SS type B sorting domain-containing protein n=1 Tax=Winogradskyella eckloniae TaxID=1089306 RepID=UPI001566117E|nr:T9SS type B sorting domain-containing protein [Winogradskyella eckloniae]NRD19855.1 T9SS type B sorting domain-containing protein [Winogradskyella eckloniae]